MTKRKKYILSILLISLGSVLLLPPLAYKVGRVSPRLASLLSPPLFNFSQNYDEGRVLVFRVGMSKRELIAEIEREERIRVDPSCWGDNRAGAINLISKEQIVSGVMKNSVTCLLFEEEGSLDVLTNGHVVIKIQSNYIRTELI